MTVFMVFTIMSFWGIIALLWCFKGFSREFTQGRMQRRLVRVEQISCLESRAKSKRGRVVEFTRGSPRQGESQEAGSVEARSEEKETGASKLRAASVIAVAIVLGSR